MLQVMIRGGHAVVDDVPAPGVEAGSVLVRVARSCISVGTEMTGIRSSGMPLWRRALAQPELAKKVIGLAATQGVRRTWEQVKGKVASGSATGYAAAGTVIAVGAGIHDLAPGDRVACAGAQCAHHAELIRVPRNLVAPIPEGLDTSIACTATLGAIALQGVRRAQPTLGETFIVIGLGVLGQIAIQLLRASGCKAIGIDLDRGRIAKAAGLGMALGLHPDDGDEGDQVARLTDGVGADGVLITAATTSDAVVETAFRCCRKKGRVVLIGDVGLHLNRADFYAKEIDFLISCSYGPGRYDRAYEEEGLDYPVAYVRWTENRNLQAYLDLCSRKVLNIEPLIAETLPVERARDAYERLKAPDRPLMVLLSYPEREALSRTVANPRASPTTRSRINVALVGAGSFAKGMHLPNLESMGKRFRLHAVMSRTGHNAQAVAQLHGCAYATTDVDRVLADPDVDAVIIATRHDLHADLAIRALAARKHVLVEKPLAITLAELDRLRAVVAQGRDCPVLLTGFNRRFSPCARRLRDLLLGRSSPLVITYRMNAGFLPSDHWVHGREGGGRNIGEACHIYDLFGFIVGHPIASVAAASVRPASAQYRKDDNFIATCAFVDGSLATLTYTAFGDASLGKERMEVFCDGKAYVLDDYQRLSVHGCRARGVSLSAQDKGQKHELVAFAEAIRSGDWPIPWTEQAQATDMALRVQARIAEAG